MPKEAESPLDRSPVPEPGEVTSPDPEPPATEHVPEKAPSVEPSLEIERTPLLMTPAPFPAEVSGRPSLVTRMPAKYGDYECYPLLTNGCLDPLIVSGNTSHLSSGGFMEKKTTMLWSQAVAHLKRLQENEKKNKPAIDNGQPTGSRIVTFPQVHKAPRGWLTSGSSAQPNGLATAVCI